MLLKKQRLCALFIFSIIMGMVVSSSLVAAEKAVVAKSPDDLLAEIGTTKITRAVFAKEMESFLATANPQAAAHFSNPEGQKMFLNQICEIYALEAKAEKLGLKKGAEFDKTVHEISVARLAQESMQKLVSAVKVSEVEVKKHYEANKTSFTDAPSYHLFQIAVKSTEKAAEIKKELDAGKSFLELAKKESTDDFKDAGGDQGFVVATSVTPAIASVLSQLKKDEVSAPIKAGEELFLIVKYTEKKDGAIKDFAEVSAQITRDLEAVKQRETYEAEMETLKKALSYELNEKSLELLKKENLTDEDKNQVLFKIGKKEVKVAELDKELAQIPPFLRPQILNGKGLTDFINNFSSRLLATENAERNFDKLAKEYPEVVKDSGKRVAIRMFLDQSIGKLTVEDKEIEDFYNKNLAKFSAPMQMSAHHILVKEEADAKKILADLNADATKFEAIAKEKSTCPSGKSSGGDLGKFGEGQMVPEFDKACKEAEVGKLVGPVKTQFGFHIIRVDERSPAGTKKLEEVKDEIRGTLLPEKQKSAFTKLVEEVKKEFKVNVYQDKL